MSNITKKINKRIEYIDIMRAIGIITVILGHINIANTTIKPLLYSFHMPLFFFVCGLTMKIKEDYTFNGLKFFLFSKIYTLLIPYFLWGLIYTSLSAKHCLMLLYGSYQTIISAESLSSLWFLTCMFASILSFELILYILNKMKIENKKSVFVILYVILLIICMVLPKIESYGYPFCFDVSICALSFIILGFLFQKAPQFFEDKRFVVKFLTHTISIIAAIIVFILYKYNIVFSNGYVLMAKARYGNFILFIITAICALITIMYISILLEKFLNSNVKRILIFIGKNTLVIFLTHKFIIQILDKYCILNSSNFTILIIYTTIILIVTLLIAKVLDKHIPILSGKQKYKIKD